MYKYLIAKATLLARDNITGRATFPQKSIFGTIIAKSRAVATAKAIELTSIPWPVVAIYSSLSDSELELAEQSRILWEQPDTKHPVTATNPRGGGKPRNPGIAKAANLSLSLSPAGYEFYTNHPNKSKLVSELIDQEAVLNNII